MQLLQQFSLKENKTNFLQFKEDKRSLPRQQGNPYFLNMS